MEIKLPRNGAKIEIFDYIPQKVFEQSQEALTSAMRMNLTQNITNDDILNVMGTEFYDKMLSAPQHKRSEMEKKAREAIAMKNIKAEFSMADFNRSNRIKVKGMILSVDGKTLTNMDEFLDNLPKSDYSLLLKKIENIEKDEEEIKKK